MEMQIAGQIETLLEIKRYPDAVKEALKGLASFPDSFYLHSLLVRAYIGAGHAENAEHSCRQLVHSFPAEAFGYYLCSIVCHTRKKFSSELSMAQEAVRLDPETPDYLKRLAEAQLQNGCIKQAKLTCERMIQLIPDDADSHELCGTIALELEHYSEAETHLRQALRLEPDDISYLNALAIALRGQKREEEAIDILFSALKRRADEPALQSNLFEFIKVHLDRHSLKGKRRATFAALPPAVQMFYQDYKKRTHLLLRFSNYGLGIFWLLFIVVFAFLISVFEG